MKSSSKIALVVALVLGLALLVVVGAAITVMVWPTPEPTCFDRLSEGPNSNTSRLDTTLDIPRSEWPAVEQIFREFAADNGFSVRGGVGTTDPDFRWLDMCDEAVTTIRAGNKNGDGERIGFGIIHMQYDGPGNDGWQPFYRDLHARLEARWPGKMRYVEGEFGRTIARPAWLGPLPGESSPQPAGE